MIFIYDEDGELAEILFIPFSQSKNEERIKEAWKEIKEVLEDYGIPFDDFTDALFKLSDYCERRSSNETGGTIVSGIGGGILGVIVLPIGGVAIPLVAGIGGDAWKWDIWQDTLALLARAVIEDVGYKGKGGNAG
jgi:hypothetical protein